MFISLKRREAIIQNERVLTVIDNGCFKVGIIQIASRLVRKIVSYLQEGYEVQRGQRIGSIRFGSQVDVFLPALPSLCIEVNPGEKVKVGIKVQNISADVDEEIMVHFHFSVIDCDGYYFIDEFVSTGDLTIVSSGKN